MTPLVILCTLATLLAATVWMVTRFASRRRARRDADDAAGEVVAFMRQRRARFGAGDPVRPPRRDASHRARAEARRYASAADSTPPGLAGTDLWGGSAGDTGNSSSGADCSDSSSDSGSDSGCAGGGSSD